MARELAGDVAGTFANAVGGKDDSDRAATTAPQGPGKAEDIRKTETSRAAGAGTHRRRRTEQSMSQSELDALERDVERSRATLDSDLARLRSPGIISSFKEDLWAETSGAVKGWCAENPG